MVIKKQAGRQAKCLAAFGKKFFAPYFLRFFMFLGKINKLITKIVLKNFLKDNIAKMLSSAKKRFCWQCAPCRCTMVVPPSIRHSKMTYLLVKNNELFLHLPSATLVVLCTKIKVNYLLLFGRISQKYRVGSLPTLVCTYHLQILNCRN